MCKLQLEKKNNKKKKHGVQEGFYGKTIEYICVCVCTRVYVLKL